MKSPSCEPEKKTMEPFMVGIVFMFIVVVVVNGIFVYLGQISWTGLVIEDPYAKGLAFNQHIQAQKAQDALGWQSIVRLDLRVNVSGKLEVQFFDADRQPLSGLTVVAQLFRPVQTGYDQSVLLTLVASGLYQGEMTAPLPGEWELRLEATKQHQTYRLNKRIQVKGAP